MKNRLLLLLLFWTAMPAFSQRLVEVTWDKTTFLVFSSPVMSVDRGSRMLLGQLDESGQNLLKLKAGSRDLPNTNLHVLTADGRLHEFEVRYAENPQKTTWDLTDEGTAGESGLRAGLPGRFDEDRFREIGRYLALMDVRTVKSKTGYSMKLVLRGIYYSQGYLFFDFKVANASLIPFELERMETTVRDRKTDRRSSLRKERLTPDYTGLPVGSLMDSPLGTSFLLAFPHFTIAEKKVLEFSFFEKHGDRNLTITVNGRSLLKARGLPEFNPKP